jgi:hypothetical protein
MAEKFLIEVPHEASRVECARVVDVFLKSGSHFLSGPVWGCRDGVHKAWMIVDVDSKDEARGILPPLLRAKATIVQLNSFTAEEIDDILRNHDQGQS